MRSGGHATPCTPRNAAAVVSGWDLHLAHPKHRLLLGRAWVWPHLLGPQPRWLVFRVSRVLSGSQLPLLR